MNTAPKPKRWSITKAEHEAVVAELRERLAEKTSDLYIALGHADTLRVRAWAGTIGGNLIGLALGAWLL